MGTVFIIACEIVADTDQSALYLCLTVRLRLGWSVIM